MWLYKDQDLSKLIEIIENDVNFWWVAVSLVIGVLSHLARALRWQMLIEPIEKKTTWYNTFMAVFVGYLANLILPRMGEVTRCGVLSKYEKISFARLAGTVLTERLTDFLFLVLIIVLAFFLKFDMLVDFFSAKLDFGKMGSFLTSGKLIFVIVGLVGLFFFAKKVSEKLGLINKLKGILSKFTEGIKSVKNVKSKGGYLFYSVFIWIMYFGMQYTSFFAMQETSHLTVSAGIIILATGSIGMLAPVQGGIGAWHGMVIATLALYGVTEEPAYAFALMVHGAQNLLVIVVGVLSFILFPLVNTKNKV